MRNQKLFFILVVGWIVSGCGIWPLKTEELTVLPPTPTLEIITEPRILISEVRAGTAGDNQGGFIELYNTAQNQVLDLEGYSLWLKTHPQEELELLIEWHRETLIPPLGHIFLGQAESDLPLLPDATFQLSLAYQQGGLILKDPSGKIADALAWGDGIPTQGRGDPAPELSPGVSLERKPGGEMGNGVDSKDNARDFALNPQPSPHNTGSLPAPLPDEYLTIAVTAPELVQPGSTYGYSLTVSNHTAGPLTNLEAEFSLPPELEILSSSDAFTIQGNRVTWQRAEMIADESVSAQITVQAPMTYLEVLIDQVTVRADNWEVPGMAGPVLTSITGGTIPIQNARTFIGQRVLVEGTATMSTGGFYAGDGNLNFYLQDESAGVQVWIPGGESSALKIGIGDQVQVRGRVELYRGAVEIVVDDLEQIQVLDRGDEESEIQPETTAVADLLSAGKEAAGRLFQVEGEVGQITEAEGYYGVDLQGEDGDVLPLQVEKSTGINMDAIQVGDRCTVIGILEVQDGRGVLYPRREIDLVRIQQPGLWVTINAPHTVYFNEEFWASLTVTNTTPERMTGLDVSVALPDNMWLDVVEGSGGLTPNQRIRWRFQEMEAGESIELRFQMRAAQGSGYLILGQARAVSRQWNVPLPVEDHYIFVGDTIPIWALQGPGERSPYVGEDVTTAGVVTGVFPGLDGFWIQEIHTDEDPRTSGGLFIMTADMSHGVEVADLVQVSGRIQEEFQQTLLKITDSAGIRVLEKGKPLPLAFELSPPADPQQARLFFEAKEGMLVQVQRPAAAVGPSNRFGEYVIIPQHLQVDRLLQGDADGYAIMVDDGLNITYDDRSDMAYTVQVGDIVSGVQGPLAYNYGNYKIEPLSPPRVESISPRISPLEPVTGEEFSIATWNVENLFDPLEPHPADLALPSVEEYQRRLRRAANTIQYMGAPDVVALQEVEHVGVLEDLAALSELSGFGYEAYLLEGTDSRGIDVGFLVRSEKLKVVGMEQMPDPQDPTGRPPLVLELEIQRGSETIQLYIINNHFKSLAEGVEETQPVRIRQADHVINIALRIQEDHPRAEVIIVGDLNSFYTSQPIDLLKQAGWMDVFGSLMKTDRYTYNYQGISQLLDYILVRPEFLETLTRLDILHINADFPLPDRDDERVFRASDHDPVVAVFQLP